VDIAVLVKDNYYYGHQVSVLYINVLLRHPTQARGGDMASMIDQYGRGEPQTAYLAYSCSR
jgi:hypothetical protein